MACLPDQFLFVNKTPKSKSLSHSSQDERFDIQSHVQSRQKKELKVTSKESKIKSTSSAVNRRHKSDTALQETQGRKNGSLSVPRYWVQDRPDTVVPKPTVFVGSGDPFNSASVQLDPATHRLLQYPFSSFIETVFNAESLSLASGVPSSSLRKEFRHRQAITERLNRCVEDELILYATLSYCSSCIKWSVGDQQTKQPPEFYMLKAIERLRPRLQGAESVDGWLIVAMYALSVTEMWAGNSTAATLHLKALRLCIEQKGGMRSLEPYVMESLILSDKYNALLNETSPILPFDWDPGPLPEEKAQLISQSCDAANVAMGRGFALEPHVDILDLALLAVIEDMVQCLQFAEIAIEISDIDEQWLFLRHSSFMYRLLALDFGAQPFSESCRLGLIIWLLKITSYTGAQRHIKRLLPRLKAEMTILEIGHREDLTTRHVGVLFWLSSVGAMGSEYTDERDWFVQQTSHLGKSLGLALEKESYKSFLKNFFFVRSEEGLNFARLVRRAKELEGEPVPFV